MFEQVDFFPGDPILSLVTFFNKDARKEKVNLSIGVYLDAEGRLPVLKAVQEAESILYSEHPPRAYLPMEGLQEYRTATQELLFGENNPLLKENKIQTIQTIGGSGALRVGASFLYEYFPDSTVYVSDPTWANHRAIFNAAGFEVKYYPYYDREKGGIRFDALYETIADLPEKSIILLHPSCHNPTGMDLSKEQWDKLLPLLKEKDHIPFMDLAYQGLGEGISEDAYAARRAAELGLGFLLANSYSKNFSLYDERVGGLSIIAGTAEEARLVFSQFQHTVRRFYSSPVFYGGHIVSIVLNSPKLYAQWEKEVEKMRERVLTMRQALYERLNGKEHNRNFEFLIKQKGIFSFTGLTREQVVRLREEYAIYLVENGRMCIAGLSGNNIDYVADSFLKVMN